MDNIRNNILITLDKTALKHHVKIPLAIESGSRGWGFPSQDSDYDCRFIYVHNTKWYLSVSQKPDTINYQPDEIYDINGWDLKKVIQHIVKSNATIYEWLSSEVVYLVNDDVRQILRQLAQDFFNPLGVSHHYLSLAINKYKELSQETDSKIKKYFYILRPLANIRYIQAYQKMPPMNYYQTLAALSVPPAVLAQITLLQQQKPASKEGDLVPENQILKAYFQQEILACEEYLKGLSFSRCKDYDKADDAFQNIIRMVWHDEGL